MALSHCILFHYMPAYRSSVNSTGSLVKRRQLLRHGERYHQGSWNWESRRWTTTTSRIFWKHCLRSCQRVRAENVYILHVYTCKVLNNLHEQPTFGATSWPSTKLTMIIWCALAKQKTVTVMRTSQSTKHLVCIKQKADIDGTSQSTHGIYTSQPSTKLAIIWCALNRRL